MIANCQLLIVNRKKYLKKIYSLFQSTINYQLLTINYGFTFIELLVVISLVGIIGTVTTQIFILSFRAQGKGEMMKEVKQSGDYTISVIESMVRNASDIQYRCYIPSNSLTIVNPDGLTTTFECDNNKISSVSGQPQTTPFPSPTGVPLTSNKVVVENCSSVFRVICPSPPIQPKYVFVNFTLNQSLPGVTPGPGNNVSVDYQTTISLRNY